MAHELDVWLFSECVGRLRWIDAQLSFGYAAEWLSRQDAVALSISLPLQTAPFDDRSTRPFFAEGQMRRLIARQF